MRFWLAGLMLLLSISSASAAERWVVYYGNELPAQSFFPFDLVVLDSDYTLPVAQLKAKGKTVLGYLSLGEAESYRSYYPRIKKLDIFLGKNPHWKGHYILDIRNKAWADIVIYDLIPHILHEGFDGIMFDTIDSPLHMNHKTLKEEERMQEAAVNLLCAIRKAHPNVPLMLNRGFDILPQAAPCIDMVLAESTLTDLQLGTKKKPKRLSKEEYGWYTAKLKESQVVQPELKIYTLDYWPMKDKEGVKNIYATQRANGFIPYVSTIDLEHVYRETP